MVGACLVFSSCDRKQPSESGATIEKSGIASARNDESMFRSEIEKGIEEQFNVMQIPLGVIHIMDDLRSRTENNDWEERRFKEDFLNYLNYLSQKGFITLNEHKNEQSVSDAIFRGREKTFTVTPTEKARQAADSGLSKDQLITIRSGICKVLEIVKMGPYESLALPQSEEYRLILGTYKIDPTKVLREMEPDVGESPVLKFRALLKLNPFTKRFTFVTADYGDPEKDDWETSNVR